LLFLTARAEAQQRTTGDYDVEVGAKYVTLWEEGGYTGTPGFLVEGGFRVWTLKRWRVQAIGEVMVVRFDDFDATYKQGAGGLRFGRMVTPKVRAFGQIQFGVQNDGFLNSNTAFVVMPGGGINYALLDKLDVQVMLDVPFAMYDNNTFNQFRLAVGIALPLGGN
jgi:hypothetical protein